MFSFKLASRANQKKKEKDVGAEFVIMNFLVKVVKKNMRPFKVWLGPLLFIKIQFKIAQLFSKHFPPCLSFYFFYFFFHKRKDTFTIPQPSLHHLVYFSPFSFVFINALITYTYAKIPYKQLFSLQSLKRVFLHIFTSMTVSLWSKIISCHEEQNVSFLFSLMII